jgi:hypothetical protein
MSDAGPKPSDALAPGTEFGDYEILGVLGAGGMGRVYRAREKTLERVVALKTLAAELADEPGFVERFLKEARAVAKLNHPNIVQIYAFGSVGGTYYLAMELLDGHSLGYYLKKSGHWPEKDAVLIVRQACRALAVAHAEGIVHRDIKPENLILTSRGEVKVVDLGIAKKIGEEQSITQTGSAIGTPHYISPEQVRGQRDIDGRADIYSLGATLYHLVTGHTPYSGSSGPHVMSMHLFSPLPDPRSFEPSLSEGMCRVLRKMLAKERDERYADVGALDLDLYQLQMGQTPQPGEPSATMISGDARPPAGGASQQGAGAASAFDSAVLNRIEERLTAQIGPMAKVLVRRTARASPSLEAMCEELAQQVSPGEARDTFRRRCLECGGGATGTGGGRSGTGPGRLTPASGSNPALTPASGGWTSAAGGAPVGEGELVAIEAALARHIGPLARVLVRKAARKAGSVAELVAALESNISDEAGRKAFRRAALRAD